MVEAKGMISCGLQYSRKVAEGRTVGPSSWMWSGINGGFGLLSLQARTVVQAGF